MNLTDEQKAGWQVELDAFNAGIIKSNQIVDEHNAILPEGVPLVEKQPLLTLDQFIEKRINDIAAAGSFKKEAAAKSNEQLLTEWKAMNTQLDAVTAEKNQLYYDKDDLISVRNGLAADKAALTAERDGLLATKQSLENQVAELTATVGALTAERDALQNLVDSLTTDKQNLTDQIASSKGSYESQIELLNVHHAEAIAALQDELEALNSPPAQEVPTVTKQQAELALLEVGKLDIVEQLIAQAPRIVQINYSRPTWRRDNPILNQLATSLGMDDTELNGLFALAATK